MLDQSTVLAWLVAGQYHRSIDDLSDCVDRLPLFDCLIGYAEYRKALALLTDEMEEEVKLELLMKYRVLLV